MVVCRLQRSLLLYVFIMTVPTIWTATDVNRHVNINPGLPYEEFASVLQNFPSYVRLSGSSVSINATTMTKSPSCWQDLDLLRRELGRELWTAQMLDSMGKMETGLLRINNQWRGHFEECLDVQAYINVSDTRPVFTGQYCLPSFTVMINSSLQEFQNNNTFTVGICVPSSCSADDVQLLLNQAFKEAGIEATSGVDEKYCQVKTTTHFDGPAIAMILLLGIFAVILIAGTVFDLLALKPKEDFVTKRTVTLESAATVGILNSIRNLFTPDTAQQSTTETIARDIIQCFSVSANVKSLFDVKRNPASIDALHGIKFLSMAWIIVLHSYSQTYMYGWQNMEDFRRLRRNFFAEVLLNGGVSVDSFFCISGLLVAYVYLRKLHKGDGTFGLTYYYFHRYWRLTPIYAISIGFTAGLFNLMGSGPKWPEMNVQAEYCRNNWWLNLLYVSNIFNVPEACQDHCWYLAVDMQLFLISPVILYPMFKRPRIGISVALIIIFLSCVLNGVITYHERLSATEIIMSANESYFEVLYRKPYSRLGPYCIGLLTGFLLETKKNTLDIKKMQAVIGWSLAVACNLTVIFVLYRSVAENTDPPLVESALYSSLSRTAWALGIAWLVTMCATGHGGVVNSFLSSSAFMPLSRLTYCAYILHFNLIQMYTFSRKTISYYDDWNAMNIALGMLVFAYVLSIPFTMTFEIAMLKVEKVVMDRYEQIKANKTPSSEPNDPKAAIFGLKGNSIDELILMHQPNTANYRTVSNDCMKR